MKMTCAEYDMHAQKHIYILLKNVTALESFLSLNVFIFNIVSILIFVEVLVILFCDSVIFISIFYISIHFHLNYFFDYFNKF